MKTNYFHIVKNDKNSNPVFNYVIKAQSSIQALQVVLEKVGKKNMRLDKAEPYQYDDREIGLHIQKISKIDAKIISRENFLFRKSPKKLKNKYFKLAKEEIKNSKLKKFEIVNNGVDGRLPNSHVAFIFAKDLSQAKKYKKDNYSNWETVFEVKNDLR